MELHITRKYEIGIFCALMAFALFFALSGFLVRPALWFDEGFTIELARNFALFGQLDILTAPHTFSGLPYFMGSNGYPLTIPLAAVFKLFGIGLLQARILMLFWLCATLGALYWVTRKLFGPPAALCALALAVTFASLYANGLTATGEMPGLFFFVIGLYFLIGKKSYFWTGIFWGLAMASKPGVFLLLAHTTLFYVLLADRKNWFTKLVIAGIGFLIPIMIWILLVFPLISATFYSVVVYALNPIDIPVVASLLSHLPAQNLNEGLIIPPTQSPLLNAEANLKLLATSPTLLYFFLLGVFECVGLWWGRKTDENKKSMLSVLLIYGLLTLFFFVRSPGWFRYLIGLQMLLFVPLYPALKQIFLKLRDYFSNAWLSRHATTASLALTVVAVLVAFQLFELYFLSNIPASSKVQEAVADVQTLMTENKNATVGIYNVPEVGAFMDPARTYEESLPQEGYHPFGTSPLLMSVPPDIIVTTKDQVLIGDAEKKVLAASYTQLTDVPKYDVYTKNP
jgi:4-amino-4-deoxy-L-arabinose transferase-like glycosyltransferase